MKINMQSNFKYRICERAANHLALQAMWLSVLSPELPTSRQVFPVGILSVVSLSMNKALNFQDLQYFDHVHIHCVHTAEMYCDSRLRSSCPLNYMDLIYLKFRNRE